MLPLYDNIRKRRIELKLSQQELAEKLGYTSRTTIAKIEAGKIDIPQSKVIAFAAALDITPGQLMGWTEKENIFTDSSDSEYNSHIPTTARPEHIDLNAALAFALWDSDTDIVDDEMIEDIKDYAKLLAERKKRRLERN